MPDADLLAALKQTKLKEMFFAFVPKGMDGKLIVSKKKIPAKEIAEARQEIGGSAPVTGRCFLDEGTMVFLVAKPAARAVAAAVKKVAKRETGLTIDPEFRLLRDADVEEAVDAAVEDAQESPDDDAATSALDEDQVLGLQKALHKLGFDPAALDGIMGPPTQEAIKRFQEAYGLPADGAVGSRTQAALARALKALLPEPEADADKPPTEKELAVLEDRRRDFKKARAAWVAAKTKAEEDLEKVKDGAHMTYVADLEQFPKIVKGCQDIDAILDNLDDELRDTLDQYASTPLKNQAKLARLANTATEILDRYGTYVEGNAVLKAIDDKEFADVTIYAPIKKALADLKKAL